MKVELVSYTPDPHALAVASARTCYAPTFQVPGGLGAKAALLARELRARLPEGRVVDALLAGRDAEALWRSVPGELHGDAELTETWHGLARMVQARRRGDDAISNSIWTAGHHTPFQHPTFVFRLEGVSRNAVESFLHQHSYYNSEQQSQRYVDMAKPDYVTPPSIEENEKQAEIYHEAAKQAWQAYHELKDLVVEAQANLMASMGRVKGLDSKAVRREAQKKAQEWARYVIPVAACTKLYHTVSGVTLARYVRMAGHPGTTDEVGAVVQAMVGEVRRIDPAFAQRIGDGELGGHVEANQRPRPGHPGAVAGSRLVRFTPDGEELVREAMAEVTGSQDPGILDEVLDPARNPAWAETLNVWDHSYLLRCLKHVQLTYHKTLSLTAYAQDQRHRTTPATRPLLAGYVVGAKHYVPDVFDGDALGVYRTALDHLQQARRRLLDLGAAPDDVAYLLPNATMITYHQSGDLLAWIHKWSLRLCFNAQKEIYEASLQELRQARNIYPRLLKHVGPPCNFAARSLPLDAQDDVERCCPEGSRWCGVKVWKNFDPEKGTPRRPY